MGTRLTSHLIIAGLQGEQEHIQNFSHQEIKTCVWFKFSPGGISNFVDPSMEKYLKDHILIAVISIEFETYIDISFNFH